MVYDRNLQGSIEGNATPMLRRTALTAPIKTIYSGHHAYVSHETRGGNSGPSRQ